MMTEYRNRTTGEIKTQGELRRDNPNTSFPKVWNSNVYNALNVDPVMIAGAPKEGIGNYQHAIRNGVEQNSNGDWVYAWQIVDMFADIEGGQTKTEQETAYQTSLDNNQKETLRNMRKPLLEEADWQIHKIEDASGDASAWRTYRQALRDVTKQSDIYNINWPSKPE